MTDNILTSVKKLLSGIPADNTDFDLDIIFAINAWFAALSQVGGAPTTGFQIDTSTTWSQFSTDMVLVNLVKEYIFAKTKLTFDPPQSGTMMECLHNLADETEWRINFYIESNGGNQNG